MEVRADVPGGSLDEPATDGKAATMKPYDSPAVASHSLRPVVVTVGALGVPVAGGIMRPVLGEVVFFAELAVMLTLVGTALFGSLALSERAFRLLRWLGNRPEPPAPEQASRGDSDRAEHQPL